MLVLKVILFLFQYVPVLKSVSFLTSGQDCSKKNLIKVQEMAFFLERSWHVYYVYNGLLLCVCLLMCRQLEN